MLSDANESAATGADAQLLAVTVSDNELERTAATEHRQFVNTAFCTQWWICPV